MINNNTWEQLPSTSIYDMCRASGRDHSSGVIIYKFTDNLAYVIAPLNSWINLLQNSDISVLGVTSSFFLLFYLSKYFMLWFDYVSIFHILIKHFQDIPNYIEKCKFLPKLNNEHPTERNSTYKKRFTSLQNLILIKVSSESFCLLSSSNASLHLGK